MTVKRKTIVQIVFIVNLLLLFSACTALPSQPTSAPTPDLDLVRTEAAQTVVAKITFAAALNPSATSTAMPANTSTPTVQATASSATVLPTLAPTATRRVSSGGAVYPTITKTPYTDQAQLVSQNPADYVVLSPNQDFDARWTIKNVGQRTWNTQFYYAYVSGEKGSAGTFYYIPHAVPVGGEVELIVDMVAPSQPGTYTTNWRLINDDAVGFFSFYLTFVVR